MILEELREYIAEQSKVGASSREGAWSKLKGRMKKAFSKSGDTSKADPAADAIARAGQDAGVPLDSPADQRAAAAGEPAAEPKAGAEQTTDGPAKKNPTKDDILTDRINWVVKNVFEPARIEKVLDDMFLDFAKEYRGSFGQVGIDRFTRRHIDALNKIKKDVSALMGKMVKESTVRSLSPYTVEIIKKSYELFHKQ